MEIFVENIEDDIFISYFPSFFWGRSPYLKFNILHPIIVFSFCDINVDSEGLKFFMQ